MRRLLLALPFALLPLAIAQAADEHDHNHEHASLGAHEHGVGRLNAVLDGQALELELDSPAMNLVGFEHVATSAADKAKVAAARKQLENPLALFNLPKAAGCVISSQELNSPLFGDKPEADHDDDDDHDHDAKDGAHEHHHDHSEIHAHYQFTCATPTALSNLDLTQVFK
ncbi:zinc-binding protein, partial [Pseudomonas fluorescens ABAC62]